MKVEYLEPSDDPYISRSSAMGGACSEGAGFIVAMFCEQF